MKSIIAALASFALASSDGERVLYWNNPTCKNPAPRSACEHDGSCELSE